MERLDQAVPLHIGYISAGTTSLCYFYLGSIE